MGAVDCRNKAPVLERSPYPNAETRPHRNAKVHRAQPALRTCLMVFAWRLLHISRGVTFDCLDTAQLKAGGYA